MSSIPLKVIYQRVDPTPKQDPESLEMEPISRSEESSVKVQKEEKKTSCLAKLCACFGVFVSIFSLIWLILFLSVSIRLYSNFNQCFHTKHFDQNSTIFKETTIERINFDVVSGIVDISFHSKHYFSVDIKNKYRHESMIEKRNIYSSVSLNQNTIQISSESPAFSFHSCQHAHIQILIPSKYQKTVSITGLIKTGYLSINGNYSKLESVDVIVEAGVIRVKNLAGKSLSLTTDLGAIDVSNSMLMESSKLLANTGSIRSHGLSSKNFETVVKYGSSSHSIITSEKIVIYTKWGYSSLVSASYFSPQDITVKTEYGKSVVVLDNDDLEYNIENKRGHMIVEYEDEEWNCKVQSKTTESASLKGRCDGTKKKNDPEVVAPSKVNVHMDTQYGDSVLIVDHVK